MKRKLEFVDGWSGGALTVGGVSLLKEFKFGDKLNFSVNGKDIKGEIVRVQGKDYDHGHTYGWTNADVKFSIKTEIGVVETSFRKIYKTSKVFMITN